MKPANPICSRLAEPSPSRRLENVIYIAYITFPPHLPRNQSVRWLLALSVTKNVFSDMYAKISRVRIIAL